MAATDIGVELAELVVDLAEHLKGGKKDADEEGPEDAVTFDEEELNAAPLEELNSANFEELFQKCKSPKLKTFMTEVIDPETAGDLQTLETFEVHDANMAEPSLRLLLFTLLYEATAVREFRLGRNKVSKPIFYGWLLRHRE